MAAAMGLDADALQAALAELPPIDGDFIARAKPVAARLCAFIEANRAGSTIVDLYDWSFNVEFVLGGGELRYWAIECLSPNDFRMYPGFERGDQVTWANVWVRDNMDVEELVKTINDVAFQQATEESGNA